MIPQAREELVYDIKYYCEYTSACPDEYEALTGQTSLGQIIHVLIIFLMHTAKQ